MIYPKHIFLTSADPLHYSHLNTLKVAEDKIGDNISIVICKNNLKSAGLFSVKERREIAEIYTRNRGLVFTAETPEEIRKFIKLSHKVVRGVRSIEDITYIIKLGYHYKVMCYFHKLTLIQVPPQYKKISSSKLKTLVNNQLIDEAKLYAPIEVINKIREKNQTFNSKKDYLSSS